MRDWQPHSGRPLSAVFFLDSCLCAQEEYVAYLLTACYRLFQAVTAMAPRAIHIFSVSGYERIASTVLTLLAARKGATGLTGIFSKDYSRLGRISHGFSKEEPLGIATRLLQASCPSCHHTNSVVALKELKKGVNCKLWQVLKNCRLLRLVLLWI